MENISKKCGNIVITVDYKVELLGIIMWLSDYHNTYNELYTIYENKFYIDNLIAKFSQYKDDDVVKEFETIVKKHEFNYDAPYALFLELDNHFKAKTLDNYVFDRLDKDESIFKFIDKLEAFAQKINFEKYYNSNINEYQKYVENIVKILKEKNIEAFLKNYYGYTSTKEYHICLLPFASDGSFFCETNNGAYTCIPVYSTMKKDNLFELTKGMARQFLDTLVHEYSHGIIDPLTEKYKSLVEEAHLFEDIKEQMSNQAYPTDSEIMNEHIIRAIETRFMHLVYQDDLWAKKRVEYDEKLGFIYLKDIIQSLIIYEEKRDKYKTFDLFYPEILDKLKEHKKKHVI